MPGNSPLFFKLPESQKNDPHLDDLIEELLRISNPSVNDPEEKEWNELMAAMNIPRVSEPTKPAVSQEPLASAIKIK